MGPQERYPTLGIPAPEDTIKKSKRFNLGPRILNYQTFQLLKCLIFIIYLVLQII